MYTKKQLEEAINNSSSISDVIKFLGLNKSSGTYKTIRNKIELWGIKPRFAVKVNKTYTHEDIFCDNSTYDRKDLRKKVIKENIIEYKCSECGIIDWNNRPLSLQLDHINGKNNDNRIINLRFLCPNCHSQTETWGNKK